MKRHLLDTIRGVASALRGCIPWAARSARAGAATLLRQTVTAACALLLTTAVLAQENWFETEALNAGLGPPPPALDRETPMAAVESFLSLAALGHFSRAAHVLDLSDLPPGEQAAAGAERAFQLSVVLERKVVIPWSSLADRPDGWLSGSPDNNDTGRVRRSILIDRLELNGHKVPIRLNRVKPGEDAEPVWVFSRQSVENIEPLYEQYGPTRLEAALPKWARSPSIWGMYTWEVLFVPLLLGLALIIAITAFRLLRRIGDRARKRWVRFVARSLRWPMAIVLCAAIIGTGTKQVLVVSGIIDAVLSPILLIAYVVAASMALVLLIDEIFNRISETTPYELADPKNAHMRAMATTISAARKTVIVIAVLAGSGVVLASVNTVNTLGFSLLASAGALTIVLGFAAREVLGNILASVQIALNRSARIGDQVLFEGHFCTVERIHFTYVQLLIWNGNRLIVPVSYFISDAFENWSIEEHEMVRPLFITLAQGADVEALRQIFLDLIEEEDPDDIGPMESAKVHVIEQDAYGKKVRFELPTANPATFWDVECRVRERLLAAARRLEEESGAPVLPPPPADRTEG